MKYETKENKNWTKDKIKLHHIHVRWSLWTGQQRLERNYFILNDPSNHCSDRGSRTKFVNGPLRQIRGTLAATHFTKRILQTHLGNATQEACKRNAYAMTKSLLHKKSKKMLTLTEQTYNLNYTSFINARFSEFPFILFKHLLPLGINFTLFGLFKPLTGCLFSEFLWHNMNYMD